MSVFEKVHGNMAYYSREQSRLTGLRTTERVFGNCFGEGLGLLCGAKQGELIDFQDQEHVKMSMRNATSRSRLKREMMSMISYWPQLPACHNPATRALQTLVTETTGKRWGVRSWCNKKVSWKNQHTTFRPRLKDMYLQRCSCKFMLEEVTS